jgi:hypothetical protein
MRTIDTDDAQPLGPAKPREPEKTAEQWQAVPGKPGLERGPDGKLRTNVPENNSAC